MKIERKFFLRSSGWALLLMLLAGVQKPQALAQTSGNVPVPEYYGVYIIEDGKLLNISGQPSASTMSPTIVELKLFHQGSGLRSPLFEETLRAETQKVPQLSTSLQVIVYFQTSGPLSSMLMAAGMHLWKLEYVRNGPGPYVQDASNRFTWPSRPVNAWMTGDLPGGAPKPTDFLVKPFPRHPDMVLAAPATNLTAGVYAITSGPGADIRSSGEGMTSSYLFVVGSLPEAQARACIDLFFRGDVMHDSNGYGWSRSPCGSSGGQASPLSGALSTPTVQPGGTPPSVVVTVPPSVAQPPASMTCAEYIACLKSGDTAFLSSRWNDALAFYQKASTLEPSKPFAWTRIASVYLITGRSEEAPALWDKALSLGGPVGFSVCHQRGLSSCEKGDLLLGPKEVSFTTTTGQKLFTVSPSEVSSIRADKVWSSAYLRLSIKGRNYTFDFLPVGVDCEVRTLVTCPAQGLAQQATVDNYALATVPKLASGALAPLPTPPAATSGTSATNATSSSTSANLQFAEQVRKVIASYETPSFHSPLDDEQLVQSIISESQASGVSLWLLFGQAKFETTFGDPINATVRDGMTFTDGSTGNAHNVFNIRPGTSWAGKVLDTGRDGKFRVYASYEDSVRDYLSLMSSNLYKGKSLDSLISTYFPPSENGSARVEEYITSVIQTANKLGFTVDRNTVPVP